MRQRRKYRRELQQIVIPIFGSAHSPGGSLPGMHLLDSKGKWRIILPTIKKTNGGDKAAWYRRLHYRYQPLEFWVSADKKKYAPWALGTIIAWCLSQRLAASFRENSKRSDKRSDINDGFEAVMGGF
jgi:hypothetical protein